MKVCLQLVALPTVKQSPLGLHNKQTRKQSVLSSVPDSKVSHWTTINTWTYKPLPSIYRELPYLPRASCPALSMYLNPKLVHVRLSFSWHQQLIHRAYRYNCSCTEKKISSLKLIDTFTDTTENDNKRPHPCKYTMKLTKITFWFENKNKCTSRFTVFWLPVYQFDANFCFDICLDNKKWITN